MDLIMKCRIRVVIRYRCNGWVNLGSVEVADSRNSTQTLPPPADWRAFMKFEGASRLVRWNDEANPNPPL